MQPRQHLQRLTELHEHPQPLPIASAAGEGVPLDVAGEAHACGENDPGMRADAVDPAKAAARERGGVEAHSSALS